MKYSYALNGLANYVFTHKKTKQLRTYERALEIIYPELMKVKESEKCIYCGKTYTNMRAHLRIGTELNKCHRKFVEDLNSVIEAVKEAEKYLERTSGTSRFKCKICGKGIKGKTEAIEHVLMEHRKVIAEKAHIPVMVVIEGEQ